MGVKSHDRLSSDRQVCALNTIGQCIDKNNIMPCLDVCFIYYLSQQGTCTQTVDENVIIIYLWTKKFSGSLHYTL